MTPEREAAIRRHHDDPKPPAEVCETCEVLVALDDARAYAAKVEVEQRAAVTAEVATAQALDEMRERAEKAETERDRYLKDARTLYERALATNTAPPWGALTGDATDPNRGRTCLDCNQPVRAGERDYHRHCADALEARKP